jgi:N-acetylglucosaminyl-diphospho-decaprenol L-rhamnosyltransferase
MEESRLSIIIVNWNVRELLRRCLESIAANAVEQVPYATDNTQHAIRLEVIVVDNASDDGSAEMVRREFPWVHLVVNPVNLGFTGGNNRGLAGSRGRYLLLLNPDAEIVGDALSQMSAYMEAHPAVGALGPKLLYPDGRVQPSRRRFPTLQTMFLESTILQQWRPGSETLRRYYMLDRPDDVTQEVDWLVGACLLIRRRSLEEVGPLDEGFFMYFEELDWCRRCRERGWQVVYLPTAMVIHHEGGSSSQVVAARHLHFQRSKLYYTRKWMGGRAAMALRFFLLATYAWQWLEEGGKWLIGHKRPMRRQRMAAYWQILRSGLR